MRKCLNAVWQAGAVLCLSQPYVAWIEDKILRSCDDEMAAPVDAAAAAAAPDAAAAADMGAPTLSFSQTCLDGAPNY